MTFERFKEIDIRVLEAIGLTLDGVTRDRYLSPVPVT